VNLYAVWDLCEEITETRSRSLCELRRLRIAGLGDLDPHPPLPRTSNTKIGHLLRSTYSRQGLDLDFDAVGIDAEGDGVKFGTGGRVPRLQSPNQLLGTSCAGEKTQLVAENVDRKQYGWADQTRSKRSLEPGPAEYLLYPVETCEDRLDLVVRERMAQPALFNLTAKDCHLLVPLFKQPIADRSMIP
jgi:hypothetical protein